MARLRRAVARRLCIWAAHEAADDALRYQNGWLRAMMEAWTRARTRPSSIGRSSAELNRFVSALPSRYDGRAPRVRRSETLRRRPSPLRSGDDFGSTTDYRGYVKLGEAIRARVSAFVPERCGKLASAPIRSDADCDSGPGIADHRTGAARRIAVALPSVCEPTALWRTAQCGCLRPPSSRIISMGV
jgi:hypothetical protein